MKIKKHGVILIWDGIGELSYLVYVIKQRLSEHFNVTIASTTQLQQTILTDTDVDTIIVLEICDTISLPDTYSPTQFRSIRIRKNYFNGGFTIRLPLDFAGFTLPNPNINLDKIKRCMLERFSYYDTLDLDIPTYKASIYASSDVLAFFSVDPYHVHSVSTGAGRVGLIDYIEKLAEADSSITVAAHNSKLIPNRIRVLENKYPKNIRVLTTGPLLDVIRKAKLVLTNTSDIQDLSVYLNRPTYTTDVFNSNPEVKIIYSLKQLQDAISLSAPIEFNEKALTYSTNNFFITGVPVIDSVIITDNLTHVINLQRTKVYREATDLQKLSNVFKSHVAFLQKVKLMPIRIPKNASTAIIEALGQHGMKQTPQLITYYNYPHLTALELRKLNPTLFNECRTFAIIRDPLERFLSAAKYINAKTISTGKFHSLRELFEFVKDSKMRMVDIVFRPQYEYVVDSDNTLIVKDIIPIERLDKAWLEYQHIYGISDELQHTNSFDGEELDFKDINDQQLIQEILTYYAKDTELHTNACKWWNDQHPNDFVGLPNR